MTQEGYAKDHLLFYPGAGLSASERDRMERYDISIAEVTVDHLVYSMGRQIENNFQSFYTVAEELVGKESALAIAREIGRRYGGQGYAKLLKAQGREGRGEPRMMALYQDLVHSIRGPKHASALFAEYDDTRCVVRRRPVHLLQRGERRGTARTPRPSRPDASRGTSLRTTTCWPSR